MKTVSEKNEVIAKWMGGQPNSESNYWYFPLPQNTSFHSDDLKYHTSWNWLMPVVEKINNTIHPTFKERINVIIYRRTCHVNDMQQIIIEATGKDMLEATYNAVYSFIEWYNKQVKWYNVNTIGK